MYIKEIIEAVKKEALASPSKEIQLPKENKKLQLPSSYIAVLLENAKAEMLEHEKAQYPSSHYSYTQVPITIAPKGLLTATYIQYDNSPLNSADLDLICKHSFIVRKLSLIAGILNAIHFSSGCTPNYLGLNETTRPEVVKLLEQLLTAEIPNDITNSAVQPSLQPLAESFEEDNEEDDFEDATIKQFVKTLIKKLQEHTKLKEKELVYQVRAAERYFVAGLRRNQILVVETKTAENETIIQVDDFFGNVLTATQKQDFVSIHNSEDMQPSWFVLLPAWERAWLLQQVPKSLTDDWSYFESLNQSSAMSQIPGIQNARMSYLVISNGQDYTLLSRSFKTSTMVPYEMDKKENRAYHVEQTARQVLGYLSKQVTEDFKRTWSNIVLSETIRPLILVQSLLSPSIVASTDTRLNTEQTKTIKKIVNQSIYPDVEIITGNDPLNFLRHTTALSGRISELLGHWNHTDKLLKYAENFVKLLGVQEGLTTEQQSRLNLIKATIVALKNLREGNYSASSSIGRNFIAFKTGYHSLLVEGLGGMVSTKCKSGKDRTSVAKLYSMGMRLYFHRYNILPGFDDENLKRQNFVEEVLSFFNSLSTQWGATSNTPGSFGLKLDPTMLCSDIGLKLGEAYARFLSLANSNKPPSFLGSEAKTGRERTKSASSLSRQRLQSVSSSTASSSSSPSSPSSGKLVRPVVSPLKKFIDEVDLFFNANRSANNISAIVDFRKSISEFPELIPTWRYRFADIQESMPEVDLLKEERKKFETEIKKVIEEFPKATSQKGPAGTIMFLQGFLRNFEDLFYKSNDLITTIQEVKYKTLPQMWEIFIQMSKDFPLLEQQNISSASSHSASSSSAASSTSVASPMMADGDISSANHECSHTQKIITFFNRLAATTEDKHTSSPQQKPVGPR